MTHPVATDSSKSSDADGQVRILYRELLKCWNDRDATRVAALFTEDGNLVGFDGSQLNGRAEIKSALQEIFGDHQTAAYVSKIREIRFLTPEVSVLRAVAGMVPPGQSDINPAVNTIHTLISVKYNGQWRIAVFQNTPAAFHGRPGLAKHLTEELRETLHTSPKSKDVFRNG
jgi:uncharacterized protein (TIGR02246 family)